MPANKVARWNGTSWSALGSGISGDYPVRALASFDDGSGPALYAGGGFTSAGGVNANRIARWNGSSWSPLASGMNDFVDALAALDDGNSPTLYAGGVFTLSPSGDGYIARWGCGQTIRSR